MRRFIEFAAWIAVLSAPLHAQGWNQTNNSGAPVYAGGFQVVHDNGNNVVAFSAQTQRFKAIGPGGTTIVGVGDWCTLLRNNNNFAAYSARTEAVVPLVAAPTQILYQLVDDDVAIVVGTAGGNATAYGFSAQTGAWQAQPLCTGNPAEIDVAISRFVIGVHDDECGVVYGFSARMGQWAMWPCDALLNATGDVLTCQDAGVVSGFSGVLGLWTASPFTIDNTLLQSHNLAYVRAAVGGGNFSPCVYSAYDGSWVTSTTVYAAAPLVEKISQNVMYVEQSEPNSRLAEAIGTRPHLIWSVFPCAGAGPSIHLGQEADWCVVEFAGLAGFSGLCGGTWSPTGFVGVPSLKSGLEHHALVHKLGSDLWLAFSPLHGLWSSTVLPGSSSPAGGGAISIIHNNTNRIAFNTRWNTWITGPAYAGPLVSATGGSVHASHVVGGMQVDVFNERRNNGQWEGPFVFNPGYTMDSGRNLLLFTEPVGPDTQVWGYSLQRGDLRSSGAVPGALAAGPFLEENVAWFIGNDGMLHAYGSPNECHFWFDHPNGSEFQVVDPTGGVPGTFVKQVIFGTPNAGLWWLASVTQQNNGIPFAGAGRLWLGFPLLVTLPPGVYGPLAADGILKIEQPLPGGPPACFQIWVQTMTTLGGVKDLSTRADPLRIY